MRSAFAMSMQLFNCMFFFQSLSTQIPLQPAVNGRKTSQLKDQPEEAVRTAFMNIHTNDEVELFIDYTRRPIRPNNLINLRF